MIPLRRFLYLRHGETDWNTEGRAQGLSDIPLNDRGRDQARDAARILARIPISAVIASPLTRARDTAAVVADAIGLPVTVDDALHEVSFGDHEGAVMGAWYEQWLDGVSTPGGGGRSTPPPPTPPPAPPTAAPTPSRVTSTPPSTTPTRSSSSPTARCSAASGARSARPSMSGSPTARPSNVAPNRTGGASTCCTTATIPKRSNTKPQPAL